MSLQDQTQLSPIVKNISSILPVAMQLNDSETYRLVEEESNIAATYWERWSTNSFSGKPASGVAHCANVKMISPHMVRQNNIYWQIVENIYEDKVLKLYLLNAYYDNRMYGQPAVKIITSTNRQVPVAKLQWW